ncbi:MAG: tripartite tricarboxylate transporter substrate binding protein [Betaproteobacteria bacterium]|nr:tripartite tricarboxylate transporter substrate binding protein [Betaproteobacteria bacterium]
MNLASYTRFAGLLISAVTLGASGAVHAQSWPDKTVRVIVPFGPGGGTDIQGRLLGKKFYESMGKTFVVDNRAGAAGLIGAEQAAKSPPDGYTVLFTTASLSVNVTLYKKSLTFDPFKDLAPVSWISSVPLVLVTHPSVPAKSVQDLLALAKKTGKLNAGNNGAGTTSYLAVEMLKQATGASMVNVSYKGGGPAVIALISGEVDFEFGTALAVAPHVASGKVKAIAVTTAKRAKAYPNLPTMTSIYPGFDVDNWYAMFMPAGTPKPIVDKLNSEILKALKASDVQAFLAKEGGEPVGSTPEELAAMFKREIAKYAKVIEAGNIAVQ